MYCDITTTYYPNKYYNISSTGTTTKNIFANDQLIATIETGNTATPTHYIHPDHLGGSSIITDQDGFLEQLIDYYPFGGIRLDEKESTFDEKRKFTGHEYDAETGLNYMVARYQDPGIGRFISVDPVYNAIGNNELFEEILNKNKKRENLFNKELKESNSKKDNNKYIGYSKQFIDYLADPQKFNSYSYANNNPLKLYDPTGNAAVLFAPLVIPVAETFIAAGGAMIAGITSAIIQKNIHWDPGRQTIPNIFNNSTPDDTNLFPNGKDPKMPNWKKVVIGTGIGASVINEMKKFYQDVKESWQKVDKKNEQRSENRSGPVLRNDSSNKPLIIKSAN